jgi:hypothetical protein
VQAITLPLTRIMVYEKLARSLMGKLELASIQRDEAELTRWSTFGQLFRSSFWDRLWIAQELIVAKTVTIVWGTQLVAWEDLQDIIGVLLAIKQIQDDERTRPRSEGVKRLVDTLPDGSQTKLSRISRLWSNRKTC